MFKKTKEHLFIANRRFKLGAYLLSIPPFGLIGLHRFYLKNYTGGLLLLALSCLSFILFAISSNFIMNLEKMSVPASNINLSFIPAAIAFFILFSDYFSIPDNVDDYNIALREAIENDPDNFYENNKNNKPPFVYVIVGLFFSYFILNYSIILLVVTKILDLPEARQQLFETDIKYHISFFLNLILAISACLYLFQLKKESIIFFILTCSYSVISFIIMNGTFNMEPVTYIMFFTIIIAYIFHLFELEVIH